MRVVVNVAESQTGRFPNPGPLELVRGGVRLIDAPGADLFEQRVRRRAASRSAARASTATARASPGVACSRSASSSAALNEQRARVTDALQAFAENTLQFLRDEGRLLAEGIDLPPLKTRFRDRHALVVARGPGHKRDLRMVRPYVRDYRRC